MTWWGVLIQTALFSHLTPSLQTHDWQVSSDSSFPVSQSSCPSQIWEDDIQTPSSPQLHQPSLSSHLDNDPSICWTKSNCNVTICVNIFNFLISYHLLPTKHYAGSRYLKRFIAFPWVILHMSQHAQLWNFGVYGHNTNSNLLNHDLFNLRG